MKRAKEEEGSISMDRISSLPKEILQRILYLLTQEEATGTSILSKSWRHVWRTRPNLVLSDADYFKDKGQEFLSVVDETLQGYLDQGVCLEEFHLCMSYHLSVLLLEKWIPRLEPMGVHDFRLYVISRREVGEIVDIPVVFEAEPLTLLFVFNCDLGRNVPENIRFVRLQVLHLKNVVIEQEIFDKIASSCGSLTDMWFEECKGLTNIKLDNELHKNLKNFTFINHIAYSKDECMIEVGAPSLEMVKIYGSRIRFLGHEFCNLKSLCIANAVLSSDLVEESQVFFIDAPNMEVYEYTGPVIPYVSFAPTSGKSTLRLYMRDDDAEDAQSWFLRLSKLLQGLRKSEICLKIFHLARFDLRIEEGILMRDAISGGNKPVVVENFILEINHFSAFPFVLNGLFCICRPKNVTPHRSCYKETELEELSEFFRKIKKMIDSGNREIWRDLEGLTVERFNRVQQEWQPVINVAKLPESMFKEFRVRLKWSDRD
ncbi:hypothetical protein ABFS82_05G049600 [Erythranthe guttata]|uniref:putative F-box/LRR-repeat protein At5g41840 n=1 Tax=Erythranthe guttata TaxID=4155 RepID=UPI00064DBEEF|nr:PREDICTED: putative F-box/LRR-repeat protein At5g41840 [Erythranthe guttata]|eukprot:XP_012846032.1 PREDICTED: putative F-box/LRR-repeat protein At5g41840 [Erythranthe guttata]